VQEIPGEALLPGDIASIARPKGGAGSEDKVVPAGEGGVGVLTVINLLLQQLLPCLPELLLLLSSSLSAGLPNY
jgi:hypothetical protein